MKTFKTAYAAALTSFLVACGGGGGGADPTSQSGNSGSGGATSTPSTALTTSSVKGLDVALTYVGTQLTAIVTSAVSQAPVFSSLNSLDSFTLNDSFGDTTSQYSFSSKGIASGNFMDSSLNAGATVYSLGGTTWSYARFGIFKNAVGLPSQYTIRHTPFFLANVSTPVTMTNATYATNGLAAGVMSTTTSKTAIKCNVIATYTQTTQEVVVTLSNCVKEGTTTAVPVTGTVVLGPGVAALNNFTINDGTALTANNVLSTGYKFAGPTGQELVGAVTVSGLAGYFTFAFGAKK